MSELKDCPICGCDGIEELSMDCDRVVVCQNCTCNAYFRDWNGERASIQITDEMIERAARALCEHEGGDPELVYCGIIGWKQWENEAKAALHAALGGSE